MGTFVWSEIRPEAVHPGVSSTLAPVVHGERIAALRISKAAGAEVSLPASPHEKVFSIVSGRARFRVGDRERSVGPQEAVLIRSGVPWEYFVLEDLDVVVFVDERGGPPSHTDAEAFFAWDRLPSDFITPAYSSGRGPVVQGERIEVARMFYLAGTEAKRHAHPNEQIQVALGGKARAFIGNEVDTFGGGGGVYFPPGVEHGLEIVEDYTLLNCKDIVPGWSVYHARWETNTAKR